MKNIFPVKYPRGSAHSKRGFVANEMFMVVAFAILLFVAVVYWFSQARLSARDNARVSDLKQISSALTLYIDSEGNYPSDCEWSTDPCWKTFLKTYMASVPKDPLNTNSGMGESETGCHVYRYCRLNNGQAFILATNLEKPKKNTPGNNPPCPLGGPNQYWVTN